MHCSDASIADSEQVNAAWVNTQSQLQEKAIFLQINHHKPCIYPPCHYLQ